MRKGGDAPGMASRADGGTDSGPEGEALGGGIDSGAPVPRATVWAETGPEGVVRALRLGALVAALVSNGSSRSIAGRPG